MKLYIKSNIKSLILMCLLLSNTVISNNKWCWTMPYNTKPNFTAKEGGGLNWGWCSDENINNRHITYTAELITSPSYASPNSNLCIKLKGDRGAFENCAQLKKHGFQLTNVYETSDEFKGPDVGEIKTLMLKLNGTVPYKCKNIKITRDSKEYNFQCLKKLTPCDSNNDKCLFEVNVDGNNLYDIEISTSNEESTSSNIRLMVTLIGKKTMSEEKLLYDNIYKPGQTLKNTIGIEDIGEIKGIMVNLTSNGKIFPTEIKIIDSTTGANKIIKTPSSHIEYPENSKVTFNEDGSTVENPESLLDGSSLNGYSTNGISLNDDEDKNVNHKSNPDKDDFMVPPKESNIPQNDSLKNKPSKSNHKTDKNNPEGGYLNDIEKKNIINLRCDQLLENTEDANFGNDYPTSNVGYNMVLAKCPFNCADVEGVVYGVGIHPTKSPICQSAIVDKAVSIYGGIISINVFSGMDKYEIDRNYPKNFKFIQISPSEESSKKSYSITKVDNVDLIEKDARILNWQGHLSNKGRAEIRINGEWGTICAGDNNPKSASLFCQMCGYKSGIWISDSGEQSCSSFENNLCGSNDTKIFFSKINCGEVHKEFHQCDKQEPECSHNSDAVVECFNENSENSNHVDRKSVKLDDYEIDKDNNSTVGRLSVFVNESYRVVCNIGMSIETPNVACKSMGYDSGQEEKDENISKKYRSEYSAEIDYGASEVTCTKQDTSIKTCGGTFNKNVECSANQQLVVRCYGNNGDPSGKSQYQKKTDNKPPELGKLGMPEFNISCDTKGNNKIFRGDPGTTIKVKCPKNCKYTNKIIWGTGQYTSESCVCASAVHSGVLKPSKNLPFLYTKTHANSYFEGSMENGIKSETYICSNGERKFAFTLSKSNSSANEMVNKWKSSLSKPSIFLELSSSDYSYNNNNLKSNKSNYFKKKLNKIFIKNNKRHQSSSFVELKQSEGGLNDPKFEYIEKNLSYIFGINNFKTLKKYEQESINEFSIFTNFSLLDLEPNKRAVIFSVNGLNLYIDDNGYLNIGSLVNSSQNANLDLLIPLKEEVEIFIKYSQQNLSFSYSLESGERDFIKDINASIGFEGQTDVVTIGRNAKAEQLPFIGKIKFLMFYDRDVPLNNIDELAKDVKQKLNNSKPKKKYTIDERACISECISSTQGGQGIPPPEAALDSEVLDKESKEQDNANSKYNTSFKNNNSSFKQVLSNSRFIQGGIKNDYLQNNLKYQTSDNDDLGLDIGDEISNIDIDNKNYVNTNLARFSSLRQYQSNTLINDTNENNNPQPITTSNTSNVKETDNLDIINIEENTTLDSEVFEGVKNVNKFIKVMCPKVNPNLSVPIYGSVVYRADSSICLAALQSGKIEPFKQNPVIIKITPPQKGYNGSIGRYDIISQNATSENMLSFTTIVSKDVKEIDCDMSLRSNIFKDTSEFQKYIVECPANCSSSNVTVYGGNINKNKNNLSNLSDNDSGSCIYSEESSICKAAINCGVLNDIGGLIALMIKGGQKGFVSNNDFGIKTMSKGDYVKSFSFVGQRSAINAYYKELFERKLDDNWLLKVAKDSKNTESNQWEIYKNNKDFYDPNGKLIQIKGIRHTGSISCPDKDGSASYIKKKYLEFANGKITYNFLFGDMAGQVVFYVRYTDEDNNVGIKIDLNDKNFNTNLFITKGGSRTSLDSKNYTYVVKNIYQLDIYLHMEVIRIEMFSYESRTPTLLFKNYISGISRGSIAIGVNKNKDIIFTGINVDKIKDDHFQKYSKENSISWDNIINKASNKNSIKNYCKSHHENKNQYKSCKQPLNFCKQKCNDELFHYPILKFNCLADCSATAFNTLSSEYAIKKNPIQYSEVLKDHKFKPTEKIDLKTLMSDKYVPATVSKVKPIENHDKILTVEYTNIDGQKKVEDILLSSGRIALCGNGNVKRSDCIFS